MISPSTSGMLAVLLSNKLSLFPKFNSKSDMLTGNTPKNNCYTLADPTPSFISMMPHF